MSKAILDSSALLAVMHGEPGADIVEKYLPESVMSSVNFVEAVSVLLRVGIDKSEATTLCSDLVAEILPFDIEQAHVSAEIKHITRQFGLSLGDCCCLALAKNTRLPVLTADKMWIKTKLGVKVRLIR